MDNTKKEVNTNKFIVERTDGTTDYIDAQSFDCHDGVIYFWGIVDKRTKTIRAYPYTGIVCVRHHEEGEDNSNEEPERHKNDNEDLISRSGLLHFLTTHWSSDVFEVIRTFEKAEYLD